MTPMTQERTDDAAKREDSMHHSAKGSAEVDGLGGTAPAAPKPIGLTAAGAIPS